MNWQTILTTLLRAYIIDINSASYTYQDSDLLNFLILAGYLVQFEVTFSQVYVFDVTGQNITPDPTAINVNTGQPDNDCISLVLSRAGALIVAAEVRGYGGQGISIQDGSSKIDLKRDLKALNEMAAEFKKNYETLKLEYLRGNGALGFSISRRSDSVYRYIGMGSNYWFSNLPRCGIGQR
jgi:hypothetical protein